jgi:hypothetical protein
MKKGRKRVFEPGQLIFLIICLIFLAHIIVSRRPELIWIVMVGASLIALLLSPVAYVFDDECLAIVYWLGKEVIHWKDVQSINLITHLKACYYYISYPHKKRPFFARSIMEHTDATSKWMKVYYSQYIE